MTIKISRLDEFGSQFDTKFLEAAIEQDNRDNMSPEEVQIAEYTQNGIIPNKVAIGKASTFGLRRAYFDIFKHENNSTKGVWQLQKDADGNEFIVKADGLE